MFKKFGRWLSALVGMLPMMAFADTSGPFTPVADDISIKVINQIFGGLLNGGNDAFGGAISTFNGAVLIVGGILATYTLLAGTLGTAHDGEMLGKKFSSVWIPIRYALGTALVLPVIGNGYCIMQQIVMWLVVQGVGLADMAWDAYMQTPGVSANMSIGKNTEDKARALAENIFMAEICVEANKYAVANSDSILTIPSRYNYAMVYDSTKRTYNFGDQKGLTSGWTKNDCGEVTFGEKIANSTVASGPSTTNTGYLGPLDNLFSPTDIQAINQAHEDATKALVTAAQTAAQTIVQTGGDMDADTAANYYKGIDTATTTYLTAIKTAANAVAMSPSDTTNSAHKYGWFMAGAYFMNTVVTNNKITNAIAGVPDSKFSKSSFNDQAEALQALGLKVLAAGNPDYGSAANAINAKADNEKSKATAELGLTGRLINAMTRGLTSIDLYNLKNDTRHPVIVINEMGSRLQAYWTGMIAVLLVLAGGSTIAGFIPGAGAAIVGGVTNALLTIIGFLGLPIMALAATAFTASYLIPMLPFMMWLGILGGWLIAVVIAVIAAPLWAVMHLHPNGDDLTGRGGNGYMLVLGLLLRPVLTIFGFIAAIVISSVMGEFINKVFFQVFSFSQGDGKGLGFFIGVIAGCAIYVAIMFSFIKKTFGLMHVIPDELMKWIGGGGDQLGHYAGKMGEGSSGSVGAVAAFTAGRGVGQNLNNVGRQLNDVGKNYTQIKENKEKEKAENAKGFNKISDTLDEKFGAGQGSKIASMLGINDTNSMSYDSQKNLGDFNRGVGLAESYGGEEGKAAFMQQMENASANGFAQEGGASAAADHFSQSIASQSLIQQAESQFGSDAATYLKSTSADSSGQANMLDLNKAGKTMTELGKAQTTLGNNFSSVMSQAVEKHGSSPSSMQAFVGAQYAGAKQAAQIDSATPEPTQASLDFTKAEEPVQGSLDFGTTVTPPDSKPTIKDNDTGI